ncbi:MAG: sigma-70 family RNA polymerase sigma factor [Pirellulales bacterium]
MSNRSDEFVELLTLHQSQIFALIMAMVQRLDDAEDVMQETVAAMWKDYAKFEPGSNFAAWACTTAKHRALQHLQNNRRQTLLSEDYLADLADRQQDDSSYYPARQSALAECTKKLREKDADLLRRCYERDQSVGVVAKQLGRPLGSVYDSLYRIRRTLHECINRVLAREGSA